jgi:hypothetical protein
MNWYDVTLAARKLTKPVQFARVLSEYGKIRRSDLLVVSYPKAGRTWLRVILGRVLSSVTGTADDMLDLYTMARRSGLKKISFTHDGMFGIRNNQRYDELRFKRGLYRDKDIVFLVRDIRDMLVSSYFQDIKRDRIYSGSIKDYLRDEKIGAKKIVGFVNLWFDNRENAGRFLLIRYEEMKNRSHDTLAAILRFAGITAPDLDAVIADALEFASFRNMRKMEEQNFFKNNRLQPGDKADENSYKVRKGKIGGYVDYLDAEDLAYIDEQVKSLGRAGCDWYYAAPAPEQLSARTTPPA